MTESTIRRRARRSGFVLRKSRQRTNVPSLNNRGHYMVTDFNNRGVLGERFDATFAQIDSFLAWSGDNA